jgi:hypothetical protein
VLLVGAIRAPAAAIDRVTLTEARRSVKPDGPSGRVGSPRRMLSDVPSTEWRTVQ